MHQHAPTCTLLVHFTNKIWTWKVGAVGAKPDGKQTKVTSFAPTCTNICAKLVLDKTEPEEQSCMKACWSLKSLRQALWQGVRVITTDIELPPPEEQYPPIFTDLFFQQQQLGWKQLMYGRISHSWATYIETRPNNINGNTFYAKIIQYIWTYAICIWQTCNQHLHNSNEQYDQTCLEATRRQIFHDAEQHPTTASLI